MRLPARARRRRDDPGHRSVRVTEATSGVPRSSTGRALHETTSSSAGAPRRLPTSAELGITLVARSPTGHGSAARDRTGRPRHRALAGGRARTRRSTGRRARPGLPQRRGAGRRPGRRPPRTRVSHRQGRGRVDVAPRGAEPRRPLHRPGSHTETQTTLDRASTSRATVERCCDRRTRTGASWSTRPSWSLSRSS